AGDAGSRRAHARGVHRGVSAWDAVPREERDRGLRADRQLPRQPAGLRRAVRRRRPGARPRPPAPARPPDRALTATPVYARRFVSLVKLEHTVFALPYAYAGAVLATGE